MTAALSIVVGIFLCLLWGRKGDSRDGEERRRGAQYLGIRTVVSVVLHVGAARCLELFVPARILAVGG